jgi:trehalose utilization protein
LKWREANDKERIWNIMPAHPIAQGIGEYFEVPAEEMYGEPFGIPAPDELILFPGSREAKFSAADAHVVSWQRTHLLLSPGS